ncbi:ComF family protein [Ferruginibacter yonginensis]|uniref:ComF family protein n=1 Tax=Ferruginibacter yonginensis TaxID=1310416 RepID=A0ABV8QSI6_9BACT
MFKNLLTSVTHLFYPHICNGCGTDALSNQQLLCIQCINDLPYTYFEPVPQNPIEHIFTGRLAINAATAGFYFAKGAIMQQLMHELKYKSNKEIGIYLGSLLGEQLLQSNRFNNIDYLIPLPMFKDKEYKRGYNQATVICEGLQSKMNIPILHNTVIRSHYTETQTKKSRTARWDNVSESFKVQHPATLKGKHILLVDDVITTGATLEACAQKIYTVENVQISIATLTTASK